MMVRFRLLLLGVLVGALAVAAGAASQSGPALDRPQLLDPNPGQIFRAGTAISFHVRTHRGDRYLWLHVSRSAKAVDACGTIGHDVSIWDFRSTTRSDVYEARPRY